MRPDTHPMPIVVRWETPVVYRNFDDDGDIANSEDWMDDESDTAIQNFRFWWTWGN